MMVPNRRAPTIMLDKYASKDIFPSVLAINVIVAAFVAGPAIRNTSAAPGEIPFSMSTAAIGTEAVAQTYNGTAATRIIIFPRKSLP